MEFVGNIARKTGPRTLLEVEAIKAELGSTIGLESGLFYVPKVIHLNRELRVLETEYIENLVTLQDLAVLREQRLPALLERAGRSLAVIHKQLFLPDSIKQYPWRLCHCQSGVGRGNRSTHSNGLVGCPGDREEGHLR